MITKQNKPRSDKRKNVGKVAEALVDDPNKTLQEISDETGLGTSTISRAKDELAETGKKDPTIAYIVNSAKQRLKRISTGLDRFVTEALVKPELSRADVGLIREVAKDDLARITLLGGAATDEEGGFKDIKQINFVMDGMTTPAVLQPDYEDD